MREKSEGTGSGFFGIIAVGIILILMGVPFIGMSVMTVMLLSPDSKFGLPLALATLFVVFLISDFTGALIAATGAGFITACIRSARSFRFSIAAAAAATALVSIFGTILLPEQSLLSENNIEALVQFYSSAGISSSEIILILDVLMYVLPSILALWAAAGVIASGAAIMLINRRRGIQLDLPGDLSLRMGLIPAWILIAALSVNLAGSSLPYFLQQAAANISIFMILPYSAVGLAVCRKVLSIYPQVLILAVIPAIVFPPIALGVLIITGILDTWFDFRTRLLKIYERKNQ
ncbi:MAG: hypothetical protein KAR44_14090 [Candidatus Aegiribacteria sp.]|nr:hypothetical protein [Candidatus Aegiribacteria sp.]